MDNAQLPVTPSSPTTTMPTNSYVEEYAPPAAATSVTSALPTPSSQSSSPTSSSSPADTKNSQALEDQNIFHLLGMMTATDQEKNNFLDELQQIIWEDFLENDVELLLTEEEMVEFKKIADQKGMQEEDRQSKMIEYLEGLIPDLEKIMLEKALELKEGVFQERLKEYESDCADNPDWMVLVRKAQASVKDDQWRAAADAINAIPVPTPA